MGGHARYSPSSGKRRLECPPSLLLEEQFPDEESPFAAEGTAGHAMAEYLINKYLKKRTKRPVSDYYSDELLEAVDDYVEYNIGQIEQANPHDVLEIEASDGVSAIRWEDVLSVYAVKVTTDGVNGMDVVTMDEQKKAILRGVMWDMNQITYRSVTVKKEVEVVTEDEDGNEVVEMQEIEETTLTIYLHHTTPEQMAAAYGFTEQQNEHLALLRHEEYSVMWASLLGGFTHGGGMIGSDADWVGTGIFAWPLPQSFTITSQFGYRTDPFTGEISYHSGTDIAAPYGTPVLAAAGGTVTVANATDPWGGSYGYYVKIQHDGTFDTLYAHCSSICVTPGQRVQQGEVIGYVGSTGNSTGNHLHFEVWENGQRRNAMNLFNHV